MAKNDDREKDKNLFAKLADLFRSGPVVKRKIKSMDTRIAMPDKLDSSSIEIFQKTTSQLYSAITSNAYNNSERLMRYNDFCFTADTLIATPDLVGYKTIKEITNLWNQGERELYTFSYDHNTKSVVASKITGAINNGIRKIIEVHLDDGSIIKCTPDHKFMLKDGSYLDAKDLKESTALMRFSRRNFNTPYRYIQTKSRGWKPEHTLIAEMKYGRTIKENEHVHHLDFTPKNNLPSNLVFMNASEHHSYHMKINNLRFLNIDNRKKQSEIMKSRWLKNGDLRLNIQSINEKLKDVRKANAIKLNKEFKPGRFNKGRKDQIGLNNANADKSITYQVICNNYENGITLKNLAKKLNITTGKVRSRLKYEGYNSYKEFTEKYENHKVLKVIDLNQFEEVYDIEVQNYHNFALAKQDEKSGSQGIVFVHNCQMEQTAEIAAALDIWADESCSIDSKGKALHIYSENAQIKKLLDELFYDTINLDFNLRMWSRNLCKYGDFVAFIDVHPQFGVLNVIPIPINEIEREEGYDKDDPLAVRYRWVSRGNQILENWQIIHMRLLGNDMFLPYGSSVIEAARRIWRQLILIEDAMLVYRIVRAPDRRVFYVDVGNIEPDQIPNYMEQQRSALRSNQVIDRSTGRVDLRYNPMSVDEDYFIPVRGGDTGTKIDTLAGGQNTAAVEDVEYIQKKLFAALKIPKAYLGFDEALSSKATLAQEDIRFSRSVQMVQRTIVSELNKLAIIHLFAHGFTGEDLINFTLKLSNPSSVAQQQKLELFKSKFEIAALAPEGLLSKEFILKNIIELTDEEINDIQNGLIDDKEFAAKLEAAGAAMGGAPGGEAGAGGDMGAAGGDMGDMGGAPPPDAGGGEAPPPENAGKQSEDGLLIASAGRGNRLPIDLEEDNDVDFSERVKNNKHILPKPKQNISSKQKRGYMVSALKKDRKQFPNKPNLIGDNGMLDPSPDNKNNDIFGLAGLKRDLLPSFLNENNDLRNSVEKIPDANTVKPSLTVDMKSTLSALESKFGNKLGNKILTESDEFSELFKEEEFEIEK